MNIVTDNLFSAEEQATLRTLAGLIVSASLEFSVPGADDALIFADILRSAQSMEVEVRDALALVAACTSELSQATPELEGRAEMAPFVSLVMQCYYRDDRVMQALGMDARPPFPLGYEVPQGDWSMLAPVQARGKIWRDA